MGFFSAGNSRGDVIVIGCGSFGAAFAQALSQKGISLLVMDWEASALGRLSPRYDGLTMIGDGTRLADLQKAAVQNADTLIAATGSGNRNILIAQLAEAALGIPHIYARVFSADQEAFCHEIGILPFCPATIFADTVSAALEQERKGKSARIALREGA